MKLIVFTRGNYLSQLNETTILDPTTQKLNLYLQICMDVLGIKLISLKSISETLPLG